MPLIWANILANDQGSDSKHNFRRIKRKLIKKYGRDWWENVYAYTKPTFATKQRLQRHELDNVPMLDTFTERSSLIAGGFARQQQAALEMLPQI